MSRGVSIKLTLLLIYYANRIGRNVIVVAQYICSSNISDMQTNKTNKITSPLSLHFV
jgi:hypothetical protein